MVRAVVLAVLLIVSSAHGAAAEPLRFMTWNINAGETEPSGVERRARDAVEAVGGVDIVFLQEVISEAQVQAAAQGFGLPHYAMSDFSPPVSITNAWFRSLEVAVLSRIPITAASEWDTTGREPAGDGFAPRVSAEAITTEELPINVDFGDHQPSRGFLRADLEGGWSVYGVHWKSSRGDSCNAEDMDNAAQRENQAEGLGLDAARALDADRTIVVGGDYNIQAPGRVLRVGTNPDEDCNPSGSCEDVCGVDGTDGYDDSIPLLLTLDPGARLLSQNLGETYVARFFPGGAIDHILVAGPRADAFETASTPDVEGDAWFGSDHRPVLASVTVEGEQRSDRAARIRELLDEIRQRATEIEMLLGQE